MSIIVPFKATLKSLVAQRLKRLPAMQEAWVRSLGQEDPLEKEMAPYSSILACLPWTGQPGGPQSARLQSRTRLNDSQPNMATHSSVLAWRIPEAGGAWWADVYGVAAQYVPINSVQGFLFLYILTNIYYPWSF